MVLDPYRPAARSAATRRWQWPARRLNRSSTPWSSPGPGPSPPGTGAHQRRAHTPRGAAWLGFPAPSTATVELAEGIPFVSDADLQTALDDAGVPPATADAVIDENATARLDGLRASLSVLAVIALIALFFTRRIPTKQPSSTPAT